MPRASCRNARSGRTRAARVSRGFRPAVPLEEEIVLPFQFRNVGFDPVQGRFQVGQRRILRFLSPREMGA